jgi:hypothetical protein
VRAAVTASIAATVLLGACGSTPPEPVPYRDLGAERILLPGAAVPAPGRVQVDVRRERTDRLKVRFRNVRLMLDGQLVADIANGERAVFYVAPGPHLLGVETQYDTLRQIVFPVVEQWPNHASIAFDDDGRPTISRIRR